MKTFTNLIEAGLKTVAKAILIAICITVVGCEILLYFNPVM